MIRWFQGRRPAALALAGAASFAELGPIAALIGQGSGIVPILLAGCAYQLGNLIPGGKKNGLVPAWVASAMLGAVVLISAGVATLLWFTAIASVSWSLQSVRRNLTARPGDDLPKAAAKRMVRVVGFALATILPALLWAPLVAAATVAAAKLAKDSGVPASPRPAKQRANARIEGVMVVHQAHYFSYCYAIPLLLASPGTGGISAAGLWFACGWVSYLSAESLWGSFRPAKVFILGHLFLAGLLALFALAGETVWWQLALWILSGLGGGTVYCLTRLHRSSGADSRRLELAEDAGHILGVAFALTGALVLGLEAASLPLIGAGWAVLAAVGMAVSCWRSTRAASGPSVRRHIHADN